MPFYIFTVLVLLLGARMWERLPQWLHWMVLLNLCLAVALLTIRLGERVRR